jgi:hypothetical protein
LQYIEKEKKKITEALERKRFNELPALGRTIG